jgi:hypothetical protein
MIDYSIFILSPNDISFNQQINLICLAIYFVEFSDCFRRKNFFHPKVIELTVQCIFFFKNIYNLKSFNEIFEIGFSFYLKNVL